MFFFGVPVSSGGRDHNCSCNAPGPEPEPGTGWPRAAGILTDTALGSNDQGWTQCNLVAKILQMMISIRGPDIHPAPRPCMMGQGLLSSEPFTSALTLDISRLE